jgi:hypothetical protein
MEQAQQEFDFAVFATPACDHARRKNGPPVPDGVGLFDAGGVAIICGRRQCQFEPASELFGEVRFKETKIGLTALAPGRWDPVAVLSACTRAHGNRPFDVDYDKVSPQNPDGLDEIRIARVVGADGVRPYRSKRGRHGVLEEDGELRMLTSPERGFDVPRAKAGYPTWAFRHVMGAIEDYHHRGKMSDFNARRAVRALEDAGLMHIELGPRGGLAAAKFTWLPRAYLPVPEPRQTVFEEDDEMAMEAMGAGTL